MLLTPLPLVPARPERPRQHEHLDAQHVPQNRPNPSHGASTSAACATPVASCTAAAATSPTFSSTSISAGITEPDPLIDSGSDALQLLLA